MMKTRQRERCAVERNFNEGEDCERSVFYWIISKPPTTINPPSSCFPCFDRFQSSLTMNEKNSNRWALCNVASWTIERTKGGWSAILGMVKGASNDEQLQLINWFFRIS